MLASCRESYYNATYIKYKRIRRALIYRRTKRRKVMKMSTTLSTAVTVHAAARPARKLLILRSKGAADYMSFCAEMGRDWEETMNAEAEKFDIPALVELPKSMVKPGTSALAAGIELPLDHAEPVPDGMEILDLPAGKLLYFQGAPYEDEDDYLGAIKIVFEAMHSYTPEEHGLRYAFDDAPKFNFGATAGGGAAIALPVRPA